MAEQRHNFVWEDLPESDYIEDRRGEAPAATLNEMAQRRRLQSPARYFPPDPRGPLAESAGVNDITRSSAMANTFTVSRTISDQQLSKIIQIESAGNPNAKAPTSTATGLFQFLTTTWEGVVKKHRPDWLEGRSRQALMNLRRDPQAAIEMGARFTEDNARALGRGWSEGDLYLAHFLGIADARKVKQAPQTASVENYVSAAAVRANRSILLGKTCGQVRAWADNSMQTRWRKAGQPDYIRKFWRGETVAAADEPEDDATPTKVDGHDDEPQAAPEPEHAPDGVTIEVVQRRLAGMGYFPGRIDGKWGGNLAGAIAGFMNDRNLEGSAEIDARLLASLKQAEAEGFRRPIAEERANVKPEELRTEVESVKQSWRARLAAKWTAGTAAAGSFFGWAHDQVSDLRDNAMVQKITGMIGSVPWYVWTAALAGVVYFIWQSQTKSIDSVTRAYRDGRLLSGDKEAS